MMNSPSMYSVNQLLKARQDGVPDYVVVPMLQKAMAQQQASQRQAALQGGANSPPPVADQILGAAQHSVMHDHMARQEPESRGIDALPSGIDEGDYKHGGIIAFAGGGEAYPEHDDSAYKSEYSAEELNPGAVSKAHDLRMGVDPSVAEDRARILSKERALKDDKESAMWMAVMKAGLATMGGKSPNALANISEGAMSGLESYAADKKGIAERGDKLDELRSRLNAADRAAHVASVTFGESSVQARRADNKKNAIAGAVAKATYNESKAKNDVAWGKIDVEREATASSAANSAASTSELRRYHDALLGGGGGSGKPMTLHQELNQYRADLKGLAAEAKGVAGGEETDEYKKQHVEYVKAEGQRLKNLISGLENRGAKSDSGANTFTYNPDLEPKVEPGMLSDIGDWVSRKTNGMTSKPVAPPAPKPQSVTDALNKYGRPAGGK